MISLFAALTLAACSVFSVGAEESFDMSAVYDALSDDALNSLQRIGANSANADELSSLSFEKIIGEIAQTAENNAAPPLKGLISITAIFLICSMLSVYKGSLSSGVSDAINITAALCISGAVVVPAVELIGNASQLIVTASNVMLAYVPAVVTLMLSSGGAVSSASYYTAVLAAGEGVCQLSSRLLAPFMNLFLGLSVTSGISPEIHLEGLIQSVSKAVRWLLTFAMTIFTAVLGVKQVITSSLDTVSNRAVRFAVGSFVPVVGSALSEAYNTVRGSVSILKSGLGVFAIIAVAAVFMPIIIRSVMWIVTLWLGKSVAEVLGLPQCAGLLGGVSAVLSTLLAVVLCVMSIYIISSAVALLLGGGA